MKSDSLLMLQGSSSKTKPKRGTLEEDTPTAVIGSQRCVQLMLI